MNKKKTSVLLAAALLFAAAYIIVGLRISDQAKEIVRTAMMPPSMIQANMTKEVYNELYPPMRRMTGYEDSYEQDRHQYGIKGFPLHLFFVAKVTVENRYDGDRLGFLEEVELGVKWRKGQWVATDVTTLP
ncbi:hypothetical protein [Paenibacillus soyae]|uniref:DUF3888 domain-containing protein n=1 Tax=Paenibacillus soyae TaxID=2969249 RepID=A0A9X2SCA4_9BACL|nr:hypothetical protein [Paenibacillus soyae]MCR2807860.1 hypothetical protein [Paenibacillus soyae]